MSLEQNSQQEQEEGPGAFLSLSAQAPSSSSSTSPFRAVEVSPREAVKQERGDLETCLSLQQPSQQALGQQTIAYLQEPQPSQALGHQTLAYLQEPQRSQALGQRTVPYLEGEQMTAAFSEQKTSSFAEQPGSSEHQKPSGTSEHQKPSGTSEHLKLSSSEHEKSLSLEGFSEHQKPAALEGVSEHQKPESLQGLPEQQKPATWVGLLEQQKPVPFLGLSEQQKPASLLLLEQQKAAASLGFSPQQNPLTLQLISEQQKLGFSVQPNLMPLQGPQKVQKQLGFSSEQQKLASPSEQEKPLPLQGPAQELNFAFPHRPQVSSLQPDQQKHASWQGHLFQGPLDEQKVVFSPKRPPEQQNFGSLQASPDQQKLNSSHVFSEQHKSAFMQAHALQGPSDQQKCSSLQGPSDQQKPESIHGHVEQQKAFPLLVTAEQQKTSYGHSLQPQRGFMVQPAPSVLQDKAGVLFSEPIVVSSPLGQDGLPKEKDYPLSRQSPRACLASPQGFEQVYPAPMATHSAVLADQRLFMETLQSLHAALGLQVSLPKIGEKDLDLHKLYKAVTCRGGLEVVIKDRKWKEVTLAFNCPPSVMTASCILRRSYISALHHYEQVYFFGAHGRIIPPPAAYATHSLALSEQEDASKFPQGIDELESRQNTSNGIVDSAQALGVDPASSVGATVTGAIDGKFENGYLVTVMVGARKMRGVLYHVASTNTLPQNACLPGMMQSVGSELKSADLAPAVGRKRRKTEVFRKDPNAPRQNRTGYNFFFAEQRAKLKTMQPDKDRAISKMIGELWNKLSEDEKIPYQAQGVKDKERYVREMKEYKEKIKLPLISVEASNDSKAVPPRLMSNDSKAVPPRIPLSHISETSNDSKAMPPRFPLTNMSEASNDFKAAPSQLPLTNMSEASNDSAVPPRLLLTYTSEALNVSQALLGNANRPNVATVVNTPNAAIVRTQKDSTVLVDTSVALTVDMSNASTDGKIPKNQVELPPSDRTSSHNPAGFEAHVQREEHTSPMEQ